MFEKYGYQGLCFLSKPTRLSQDFNVLLNVSAHVTRS